jgi:hypothetical protein
MESWFLARKSSGIRDKLKSGLWSWAVPKDDESTVPIL